MRIINCHTYEAMSRKAADILAAQIQLKPNCVLGLATGTTPIGAYQGLIKKYESGSLDFSEVRTYNLDEYRGLTHEDPQSYHYFMNDQLFNHVNIDPANVHVPDGANTDADAACADYDRMVAEAGYCDLQLLGIGRNGHIGFNEPADDFTYGTHVVTLAADTIEANARFFKSADEVPRQAVSMGIGNIMAAKCVVLVATGENKAKAVYDTIRGPITPRVPASVLQLHPCCVILTDREAGKLMLEE